MNASVFMQTDPSVEAARQRHQAQEVMNRAKVHISIYHPFFGALIQRLKLKCDPRHQTMYTDAVVIGYNPEFVAKLQWEEVLFIQLHEVMHCALRHPFRRAERDPKIWGQAVDHAANLALLADPEIAKLRPRHWSPAGEGLADERFEGLAAEQIYSILLSEQKQEEQSEQDEQGDQEGEGGESKQPPLSGATGEPGDCLDAGASGEQPEELEAEDEEEGEDSHEADAPSDGSRRDHSNDGEPSDEEEESEGESSKGEEEGGEQQEQTPESQPNLDPSQLERLEREWSEATSAAALAQGDGMGSEAGQALKRALGKAAQVRRSFEEYVDEFAQRCFSTDESWKRSNRRFSSIYLPSRSTPSVAKLIVGVDTSASVREDDLARFGVALERIVEQFDAAELELVYCDAVIQSTESFRKGDTLRFDPSGGGGTKFTPVFEYALEKIEQGEEVAGVIYLTDLEGFVSDPQRFREIETLWVCTKPLERLLSIYEPDFGRVCCIHD